MVEASMKVASSLFSHVPPLFLELTKVLQGDTDCSTHTLTKYSTDGSPYHVTPQIVLYPKNATDIKQSISFAREFGMPITVRGGGTSRTGGALGEGMVLDLSRYFTHIRQINMMEHTITVDAGVTIKALREKLHGWHVDIPILTADNENATLGGLVATRSATPSTFHHGTIRDWVEALTVVVDTGEEHRIADGITPSGRLLGIYQSVFPILSRNSPILRAQKRAESDDATGYFLWNTTIGPRQLLDELVGSEGTLGVITSVTLRLAPFKPHYITTCIPITETALLTSCITIAKHHGADHIFLYDSTFRELAKKHHAGILPSLEKTPYVLLVTHHDTDKERLHVRARTFLRALPIPSEKTIQIENAEFIDRITSPSFLISLFDAYTNKKQLPVTTGDGIIVPLHNYGAFLHEIDTLLSPREKPYSITGNAGSGHLAVTTLFDQTSSSYDKELREYNETIFTCVKKYKGGISAVGGDGLTRTPYLSFVYNEQMLDIFKQIKEAWDPKMILNPNKKIATTTQYLHEHLYREIPT